MTRPEVPIGARQIGQPVLVPRDGSDFFRFRMALGREQRNLFEEIAAHRDAWDRARQDVPPPPLDVVAARLRHDLRTRFPEPDVVFRFEGDSWECSAVFDDWCGATTSIDFEEGYDWPSQDIEELVADVAFQVADNLWPDDLADPWPLCPTHRDHPLNPRLRAGLAAWACGRDESTRVRIGSLRRF